jgi:hypothetical protein
MTNEELLNQLFPLPEGVKLRKPRFGTAGPSAPVPIRVRHVQHARGEHQRPAPPFEIKDWNDPHLGLTINVLEDPDGEVWAYVDCNDRSYLGKEVSVALLGSKGEYRLLRRTIALNTETSHGCSGKASFGKLQDLAEELGDQVQLSAFLLE